MENNKFGVGKSFALGCGLIIFIMIIGFSYAFFSSSASGSVNIRGRIQNTFDIELIASAGAQINAPDLIPLIPELVAEEAAKTDFSVVTGANSQSVVYNLSIVDLVVSPNLRVANFRWELQRDDNVVASGNFVGVDSNQIEILSDVRIESSSVDQYVFRIWVHCNDENQRELMNGTFRGKFSIVSFLRYEGTD